VENPREPATFTTDNLLPTAAQVVDGRHERLDRATGEILGRFPADIDLAAHARGPARQFLATVVDGASLPPGGANTSAARVAVACRSAWHAIAASSSDVRITLTIQALDQLSAAQQVDAASPDELHELIVEGRAWRAAEHARWPASGSLGARDFDPQTWA